MDEPLRILLMDESSGADAALAQGLRDEFPNIKIDQVHTEKEFKQALHQTYDLALTPYQLSWNDGFKICAALKAQYANMPVILLVAQGQEDIIVDSVKAGLDAYIIQTGNYLYRLSATIGLVFERRVQSQAAREIEAELHSLFDRVPVGLYRITPEGNILEANQAFVRIAGCPDRETLMLHNIVDFFVSKENFAKWCALVDEHDDAHEYHGPALRLDGSLMWVRNSARAVRGSEGRVIYYEGALDDITTYERAQEIGGIGTWVSSLEDKSLKWSRQTYRIFGIPNGTAVNVDTFFAAVHPDDREPVRLAVEKAIAERSTYSIDHRVVLPDGSQRWVYERADVVFDASGRAARLIGVVQDITERKRSEEEAQLLQTIALTMGEEMSDLNSALEVVLRKVCETTGWLVGEAWLPSGDNTCIEFSGAGYTREPALDAFVESNRQLRFTADQPIVGTVWSTKKPLWVEDISDEKRSPRWQQARDAGLKSVMGIPVLAGQTVVAVLAFLMRESRPEDQRLMDMVSGVAAQLGLVIQRKTAETRLHFLSHFDGLTGLPNRTLLADRLQQAVIEAARHERLVGLVFLDLDRFKNINDSLGHEIGDQLLKSVGERLTGAVRKGDTIARLSGDEFALVLADMAHADDAARVAHKILETFEPPFHVGGHEIYITASLGITLFPLDDKEGLGLLRNADVAMFRAKEAGRNAYQFYSSDMTARAAENLSMENDLRHAIQRNELILHYQPLVDSKTARIMGFEALVRWRHSKRGMISPMQFIPLAEENGLIVPIGEWVLRKACAQCKQWRLNGHPDLRIAVNLSARQFQQGGLDELVVKVLNEVDLDPSALELELTESIIMQSSSETLQIMKRLADLGVTFSIDDFGTGYSNLAYLKRFPVDILKVDRTFVKDIPDDPDDSAIADAIITMAHSLGMQVIAEGVETEQQSIFMRSHGCDAMQGFYFSKPLPSEEIDAFLQKGVRFVARKQA